MLTDLNNNIAFILYATRNLPVKVYTTNKMVINYVYDIDGNRISNTWNSGNTGYSYVYGVNGQTELRNKISSGSVAEVIHNIYGNDLLGTCTVTSTSSEKNYFLKDHLGSIKVIVNEDGSLSSYTDYDPFGLELTGRSDSEERYKFTGKERDEETSYDYFGARYYDSSIGRWLQVDPLADKYLNISVYVYALNSPLKFIDPKGTEIVNSYKEGTEEYEFFENYIAQLRSTTLGKEIYDYLNGIKQKIILEIGHVEGETRVGDFVAEGKGDEFIGGTLTLDKDKMEKILPESEGHTPLSEFAHELKHAEDAAKDLKAYGLEHNSEDEANLPHDQRPSEIRANKFGQGVQSQFSNNIKEIFSVPKEIKIRDNPLYDFNKAKYTDKKR